MVTKIDLLIIAGAGLALFLIIRGAGQALGNIGNPFKDFKFPEFDFSTSIGDFGTTIGDFGAGIGEGAADFFANLQKQFDDFIATNKSSIAGETVEQGEGTVTIPKDTVIDPDTGIVTSDTPPTGTQPTIETFDGETFPLGTFAQERASLFDFLVEGGFSPSQAFSSLKKGTFGDFDFLAKVKSDFIEFFGKPEPAPLGGGPSEAGDPQISFSDKDVSIGGGFFGGGPSFIGGSIFETPIQNLSLSQIIDKFNVTASQAANIKAIAGDLFPSDFDFGTNTGGGIGSILQTIQELAGIGGNVSNPNFEGFTLEEIANKLTGGNISNF